MRICILGDAVGVHVYRIASGLAAHGHEVRVCSHHVRPIPGVDVVRFQVPSWSWRYPGRWTERRVAYLRRLMREHDVVHVHFLHDWGLTPDVVETGRLVVSPWGSDIVKPPDVHAYPADVLAMRRELLRMANAITAWGPSFAAVAAEFAGVPLAKITTVPLGVELTLFRPPAQHKDGPPTVGFFKGFRAVYGPTVWVRAMAKVLAAVPDARFEMIGDGPLLEECHDLARSLGVDKAITWTGALLHEELPERIAAWDVTVMPSICESFGLAALESSAMRVPVVASSVGGVAETVRDGETGLLVPPYDPDGLADAVVGLLRDPDRRAAMGEAGREMVASEYAWSSCLERWVGVYRQLCMAEAPA